MANTCTICRHKDRVKIDAALIENQPFRRIASQFEVGEKSVERHQECIAELLQGAKRVKAIELAATLDDQMRRVFDRTNRLYDACHEWLTDPEDPRRYTLDARTGDIDVIYEEQTGAYEDGSPRWVKKRATLSQLLREIESAWAGDVAKLRVISTESKTADPRSLILETAKTLNGSIDRLAKLTGAYQQDRANEHDRHENRETLIQALHLFYAASSEEMEIEKALARIRELYSTPQEDWYDLLAQECDESLRAVNARWAVAREEATRKGKIIY
jgi:hypothetical protein